MEILIILIPIVIIITIFANFSGMKDEINSLRNRNDFLSESLAETQKERDSLQYELGYDKRKIAVLHSENDTLRKSLSEAPLGFPSLLEAIRLYDAKHDEQLAYWLETKSHPAYTAAQTVRTETQKRRNAEQAFRRAKLLLDYYFSISPDAQEDLEARTEQSNSEIEAPSLDNSEDIAGRYLSTEEYSRLSVTQRNQLAIDRFWSWKKSKRSIGRLYEQYIGWLYEHNGWLVDYFGISEGFLISDAI